MFLIIPYPPKLNKPSPACSAAVGTVRQVFRQYRESVYWWSVWDVRGDVVIRGCCPVCSGGQQVPHSRNWWQLCGLILQSWFFFSFHKDFIVFGKSGVWRLNDSPSPCESHWGAAVGWQRRWFSLKLLFLTMVNAARCTAYTPSVPRAVHLSPGIFFFLKTSRTRGIVPPGDTWLPYPNTPTVLMFTGLKCQMLWKAPLKWRFSS